jgi:hypothetical protein
MLDVNERRKMTNGGSINVFPLRYHKIQSGRIIRVADAVQKS